MSLRGPFFPNLSAVGTMHTGHPSERRKKHAGFSLQSQTSPIFAQKESGKEMRWQGRGIGKSERETRRDLMLKTNKETRQGHKGKDRG